MTTDTKINTLLVQLLKDTFSSSVRWVRTTPPRYLSHATEEIVPLYFESEYMGLVVGVYEARYRYYRDEDEYYWMSEPRFAIVQDGTVVFELRESSPALNQLFDAVRKQASGLDSIINGMLR